jgi:hypothetical protein
MATLANFYLTTWEEYHTGMHFETPTVLSAFSAGYRHPIPWSLFWTGGGYPHDCSHLPRNGRQGSVLQ